MTVRRDLGRCGRGVTHGSARFFVLQSFLRERVVVLRGPGLSPSGSRCHAPEDGRRSGASDPRQRKPARPFNPKQSRRASWRWSKRLAPRVGHANEDAPCPETNRTTTAAGRDAKHDGDAGPEKPQMATIKTHPATNFGGEGAGVDRVTFERFWTKRRRAVWSDCVRSKTCSDCRRG